jgi:hypothetical protein
MKKRYFTLLALLLSVAVAPAACGGDDDDDDNKGEDNKSGNGGGNEAGNGNNNNAGNGNNNQAGRDNNNNNAGRSGSGGGGNNNGNQVIPDEGELTFTGNNVEDIRGVFPFGVAIAPNGAIFVSSLGDRNANNGTGDEPARIYRFNPGDTSNPEVLFEASKAEVGIYGLTFMDGNLYACISQHVLSNVNVTPSIYEITDIGGVGLDAGDVTKFDLNGAFVANNNGAFAEGNNTLAIDRCGQIANDGTAIYAPDVLNTGRIYRLNPTKDADTAPNKEPGDNYSNEDLSNLRASVWLQDAALVVNGEQFGTTAIAASEDGFLKLFLANNDNTIFNIGLKDGGLRPEANNIANEPDTLNAALNQPFGIAAVPDDNDKFVASDLAGNKLVVLTRGNNGNLDETVEIDDGDDNSFVQPGAVVVVGNNTAIVVSTQINQLLAEQQNNGEPKVFIRKF